MRCPPTLDIFYSRDFPLKRNKEYSPPFTQLQILLTTTTTSNFEPPTTVSTASTTNCYKTPPKFKTSPPTSPLPTTIHSTSTTSKHLPSEKDTTPTSTITITPTSITVTPPTRIPALMSINTSLQPRFCISSPHAFSITIPLSPSIPLAPIFPQTLQKLQQSGRWEVTPLHQHQLKEVTITWRF